MITDLPTKRISNITVTKISRHFTYKMAAKTAATDMKQNYVTVTLLFIAHSLHDRYNAVSKKLIKHCS